MKKLFFFLSFCLFAIGIASAQNPVLITNADSLKLDKDYNQLIPAELSKIVDANTLLKGGLNAFMRDHLMYSSEQSGFPFAIFPANGSFNIMIDSYRNKSYEMDYLAEFEKLKKYFFQNKNFYESLYTAVIPLYKTAVHNMTSSESQELLYEIMKGINYTKNFDLDKETAAEKLLGAGFALKKGKLSAFVYRRIANKELSKEECMKWLNKIYTDLLSSVNYDRSKEEDYILEGTMLTPGYFTARKADVFDGDYQIIRKTNNGYKLLLPENSIILTDFMIMSYAHDLQSVLVAHPGGKKEILIFSADTVNTVNPESIEVTDINCYPTIRTSFVTMTYEGPQYELFVYEPDGNGKLKLKKYEFEKNISELFLSANYVCIKFEDKSSEMLYLLNEGEKKIIKKYIPKTEVKFFSESTNGEYTIINYETGNSDLISIRNNQPEIIKLDQNLEHNVLDIWKGYMLIHHSTGDDNLDCKIYSPDGKLLIEGLDHLISSDSINFIAGFKKGKYILYNSELKAFAKDYETPINQYNNQKDKTHYLTSESKVLILTKYSYKKGKIAQSKTVVFDRNGKAVIPEKWPYLKRISLDSRPMEYYAVCNKVSYSNNVMKIEGKFALFSPEGKQLTDFIYDNIVDTMSGNGFLECKKNGKLLKLDENGNEIN